MVLRSELRIGSAGTATRPGRSSRPRRVVILYKSLPQYRAPFFDRLRDRLQDAGLELQLLHGLPAGDEALKADAVTLPWAQLVPSRTVRLPGSPDLYWQPCLAAAYSADLVIVEQASKLLVNYPLLAMQRYGTLRVAFWGHGRSFKVHGRNTVGEMIKRRVSRYAHWWFAYNALSADIVAKLGYPRERITTVNNAIDSAAFLQARKAASRESEAEIRTALGLATENVGIYCGALYPAKRVRFLVEAVHHVRRFVPDFELLILGAGQDEPVVRTATQRAPWIHYFGPTFGGAKVPYFLVSKLLLLPGLVGLAITDAFAFQVPVVTIDVPDHSPEIEYLVNGENGIMLPPDASPEQYASVVSSTLLDASLMRRLRAGCMLAASTYTLEAMVERFAGGVLSALDT